MPSLSPKFAGGMAAAVALATAFAGAQAATTPLYSGGGTLAEKVYRDIFNQYGSNASGDLCSLSSTTGGGTLPSTYCSSSPYNSSVEALYVGVGSGNGKKALDTYNPANYVAGSKKPDNPPVPSGRDFGAFYGAGTGSGWAPGTGVGPFYPSVTFSGSDDPLNSSDISTYSALPTTYGPLVEFPAITVAVTVPFTPTAGWTPKNKVLAGGSSAVNLSTNTLCGIWTGAITNWNNAEITKDNKGTQLGSGTIVPVFRNDGSGTTFLFSNGLLNQCGTASHPVSTHPFPDAWLTAAVQGTAITYNATPTPILSKFYSNDNFFINVFKAGLLPSNFYNNAAFSGVTGGCSGSGGVLKCVDATPGALGYLSPDFVKPIATGNDTNGNPIAATANLQTYYTYSNGLTAVYEPPSAAHAVYIMSSATPPSFTGGATAPATNPLNWGVVNPIPSNVNAYPIGGFTFIDLYSCYASKTTLTALVGTTAKQLGLFRWYVGSTSENAGIPLNTLAANGFSQVPNGWLTAIKTLLTSNTYTKLGTPKLAKTACATVANGA